jgi:ribose/xylose/arabinose/galactoside ABC-type transport system permease subunit
VLGLVNAILVVALRIKSVIATIATLGMFIGAGEILRPVPGGLISPALSSTILHAAGHIPVLFIVVTVLAVVGDLFINATRTGLMARAVGYSAQRARQMGVRTPLFRAAVYVVAGLLTGGRGSALGCLLGALFVAEIQDFIPFINLPNGGYLIAVGVLTVLALITGIGWTGAPRLIVARYTSKWRLPKSARRRRGTAASADRAAREIADD